MRFLGVLSAALLASLALTIGVARWIGQQREADVFPLPEARGCWQSICFFDMGADVVPPSLNAHRDVLTGSAAFIEDRFASPFAIQFEFTYAPEKAAPMTLLLYWASYNFSLKSDSSLLPLGHVVGPLGAPERVTVLRDKAVLYFPARNLTVYVIPAKMGEDWVLFTPQDAVVGMSVVRQGMRQDAPPASMGWQGLGMARFAR